MWKRMGRFDDMRAHVRLALGFAPSPPRKSPSMHVSAEFFPLPLAGEGARNGSVGFNIPEQGSRPYTAFAHREIDTWTRVIKTAGIKPQ